MLSAAAIQQSLQRYRANTPLAGGAVVAASTSADVGQQPESAQHPQQKDQVKLSIAARTRQALATPANQFQQQANEAKKAKARQRIAETKQRIDELTRLLALFGAMAPKALLRELQQLAGELKAAAKALKEAGGETALTASIPPNYTGVEEHETEETAAGLDEATGPASDVTENTVLTAAITLPDNSALPNNIMLSENSALPNDTAPAEPVAASSSTIATALNNVVTTLTQHSSSQTQQHEDQRLLQKTLNELKALVNRVKALLGAEASDKETAKQLKNLDKQLADTEDIAAELGTGGSAVTLELHILV